jgi:hypothetical protein
MKIYLVKQYDNTFKVAGDSDYQRLKKIKPMEMVECEIKKPRNIRFHKLAFALFNMVFQNQERYTDLEALRYDLTVDAGYYTKHTNLSGDIVKTAKSISFASMDDTDFSEYYEAIIKTIVLRFNFDSDLIRENVDQHF